MRKIMSILSIVLLSYVSAMGADSSSPQQEISPEIKGVQHKVQPTSLDFGDFNALNKDGLTLIITHLPQADQFKLFHVNKSFNSFLPTLPLEIDLSLYSGKIDSNAVLKKIVDCLPRIKTMNLNSSGITHIKPLAHLNNLSKLFLNNVKVEDFTPLNQLPTLTYLELATTHINDLVSLSSLTNLSVLNLMNIKAQDFSPLSHLSKLTILELGSTPFNDLTSLSPLTNLSALGLMDTKIQEVTSLSLLTNLTMLDLGKTAISILKPLTSLSKLSYLGLNTKIVSKDEIETLKKTHPNLAVEDNSNRP